MRSTLPGALSSRYAFLAAAVIVAFVINLAWFGFYTFINAYLTVELQRSDTEWTRTSICFAIGTLLAQFLTTEISARIGRRRTVNLSIALAAAGYALMACTRNIVVINVVVALLGFVPVALAIAWTSMVATIGGERPGRAIATYMVVNTAVGAGAIALGGLLVDQSHYRLLFAGTAVVCAAGAFLFPVASRHLAGGAPGEVVSLLRMRWNDFAGNVAPIVIVIVVLGFCMEPFMFLSVNQLVPNICRQYHGMGEGAIGLIVGLGRLPALASLFVVRHLIDRLNAVRVYGVSMAIAGIAVVCMGYAQGMAILVLCYVLYYLVYGAVWGSNLAALNANVTPQYRDIAITLGISGTTVFNAIASVAQNRMLEGGASLAQVFLVCGLLGGFAGAVLACTRARRR